MITENHQTKLKTAKEFIKNKDFNSGFEILRSIARPEDDFTLQHRYAAIYRSIPEGELDLKPVRVAFAATTTVEHFIEIFRFYSALEGFDLKLYLAEFNTIHQTVLDAQSGLYAFNPDVVWLFTNYRDVATDALWGESEEAVEAAVRSAVDSFAILWNTLKERTSAHLIMNNADLPPERVFGNHEAALPWSRQSILKRFNNKLSRVSGPGITIFDLEHLSSIYGKSAWFNERFWYHSKHGFAMDASGFVAFRGARLLSAIKGRAKKCIVVDLDNTLWGGVVGDDGLEGIRIGSGADGEAFAEFQLYLKALGRRGIILAVCSKNDEDNAKRPFIEHPDMKLRLEDIAVFTANWNSKAENIRKIAEILDIGLDSMVFVDDNPFERNLVSGMLPMVAVPDMPEDPALYIRALDAQCYFETISFSEEDKERGAMYRSNTERKSLAGKYENMDDYLKDLEMEATASVFEQNSLARISQLINKSNQFHLTTTRYSEAAIMSFMKDSKKICLQFRLKDRLGDNGLIALVIMDEVNGTDLLVDTWVMSCRVLSRGMEEFIHNEMIEAARSRGYRRIIGRYIPTKKNSMVSQLYQRLGYSPEAEEDGMFLSSIGIGDNTRPLKTFVSRSDNSSMRKGEEHD